MFTQINGLGSRPIYVKRGAVVEAEPFDPARSDQGVSLVPDAAPLAGTLTSRGRQVTVREGDVLVTDSLGPYPIAASAFVAMFQPLDEVLAWEGGPQ